MRLEQQAGAYQLYMKASRALSRTGTDPTTLAAFGEWTGGGKYRIRDQSGDYLGGSGDLWSVAVVIGEKWIYLRHKLEVTLIGLSDRVVGR